VKWYPPNRTHPIRLEKQPWTGRRKPLPEYTGVVVATSQYGIKVVQDGGWLNWSLPDYRGTPFDKVEKGDKVRFEYAEVEKDGKKKTYISVIENLSSPQLGMASGDIPFPPEEDFGPEGQPDFGGLPDAPKVLTDAPGSTPGGTDGDGQTLWAKDRLKARTDCIACAVGIFKSSIEMGLIKEAPTPEKVVAYAATLELWAKE